MKNFKSLYLGVAALAAVALTGCQADMDTPEFVDPVSPIKANMTLAELKAEFVGKTLEVGTKENGDHYIVHGRIVSSDATGNIYQWLSIQDETAALIFSIRERDMWSKYRLGQDVVVDLTGLWFGLYNNLPQVGSLGNPYDGQNQIGYMYYPQFVEHAHLNGLPNNDFKDVPFGSEYPADSPYCIIATIEQINNAGETGMDNLKGQLVEFRNVHFALGGQAPYAVKEENNDRTLLDASGNSIIVRNSGYSNFYTQTLPAGRGNVRGVLSYYSDKWQLYLRGPEDVFMTEKGLSKDSALNISEVLEPKYTGIQAWVGGYIVGSVKAGVSAVTSADDIIWGADADLDNNLVVAASADETDPSKCITVQLPQNTQLRTYGNLADNPGNYKKHILVNGTIGQFLGLTGIVDIAGNTASFEIEGVDPDAPVPTPEASGSGTEADPYNIGYVMRSTADESDVWVTGYVVGYVSGKEWPADAEWSPNAVAGSSNYANSTNVILSEMPSGKAVSGNSVPAGMNSAVKPTLGLKNNPGIFGKKVKVKCRIATYLDARAVRNISEVKY